MIANAAKDALKALLRLAQMLMVGVGGVVAFFVLVFTSIVMLHLTAYVSDYLIQLLQYLFEA